MDVPRGCWDRIALPPSLLVLPRHPRPRLQIQFQPCLFDKVPWTSWHNILPRWILPPETPILGGDDSNNPPRRLPLLRIQSPEAGSCCALLACEDASLVLC